MCVCVYLYNIWQRQFVISFRLSLTSTVSSTIAFISVCRGLCGRLALFNFFVTRDIDKTMVSTFILSMLGV